MNRPSAFLLSALLVTGAVSAQEGDIESSSDTEIGVQQVDVDTDSSKFNEYRDLRDGLQIFNFGLDFLDNQSGRYLELHGSNLLRDDQTVGLRTGRFGRWGLELGWNETPHLLSNKAQSPYFNRGDGLLELPATVPITFKKLATSAADAPNVVASDQLTAAFLADHLQPIDLGTQRNRGTAAFHYDGLENLGLGVVFTGERRSGSKVSYGPIGDRPPRTLNVQLAEPIDYDTRELRFEAEHAGERYQVGFSYTISEFENSIDTLTWRNMFATPAPGAEFDAWDRAVSVYGRRPLAPDNQFQNANLTFGIDAPLSGRLNVTAAFGMLDQDEDLLAYSFASSILVDPDLPRASADAQMNTSLLNLAYAFNPAERVNVRAFYRYYNLDNQTPEDDWWYVTSDTSTLTGTRSYKNRRTNLAFEYDTQNLGVDTLLRLGWWRGTLGLDYEREEIGRAFREADTSEDRFRVRFRGRPNDWLSLRLSYLLGDRQADDYNTFVTAQSYWYTPAEVNDKDNPQFTFTNHPDMRRFDVSDRKRNQFDFVATAAPGEKWSLSATLRYRDDDFDSEVRPTQPLLGTGLADRAASTPGDQLGLLEDTRKQVALDAFFTPTERFSWNVFISYEVADSLQRSIEFDENHKEDPSSIANAELGPWTRAGSQWSADSQQDTTVAGLGLSYEMVPQRVTFRLDSSLSRSDVDIIYSGFGTTNAFGAPFADNHQFGFRTPPTIRTDQYVADLRVETSLTSDLSLTVGYLYDRYQILDWQQEANTPWYESVGSEFLLRDTSRSHQWGNRLPNLGSYLAPDYAGNVGYLSLAYNF